MWGGPKPGPGLQGSWRVCPEVLLLAVLTLFAASSRVPPAHKQRHLPKALTLPVTSAALGPW